MTENEIDGKSYSQVDYLAAIGFQAQPGDIYYMNPPKELSSYPMYIDNPKKVEKPVVGSFIQYTMDGTDITEPLTRRYSDFFSLYEKLLQRWPGIYIPRVPPKKITGNMDPSVIRTRMRLLNRFCLNLSNIEYLYKAEETNIFRNNIPDVANAINKLPELSLSEILTRMKEAFPEYNENYDIIVGKSKFETFETFLTACEKKIGEFKSSVDSASEKRDADKKQFLELVKGFTNYEKDNMMIYADNNVNSLIFFNPAYSSLSERVLKLKQDMINPFVAFRDWLQEEILDVEAMKEALKQIRNLLETESKLKDKLNTLEEDLKKGQQGQVNIFKSIFKKKEDIIAEMEKEKEITQQKIADIGEIIKIVGDNMENQIEIFKNDKTQNYYKYLKMFAILQRESNRVIRELWTLVKNGLNEINPNMASDDNYQPQPEQYENNEQNEIHEDYEKQEPQEQQEQQDQNEIHEEKIENQEQNEEQPPQEGEEGGNTEE
jgi:hypothetical protein